jgi:murein DD-endopeptidase MepM/ murein hydrolase activator NlpD
MKRGLLTLLWFILAGTAMLMWRLWPEITPPRRPDPAFQFPSPFLLVSLPLATRFDFPLGSENGALTYNAQPFTQNLHLGDDLNGIGGENSDLGDPIYAVADGAVLFAGEGGPGWGNVIIVLHAINENGGRRYVQSYYAHCETILVHAGDEVHRGERIATVGTGGGRYFAHLHFEIREFITPFIGAGYRKTTDGWLNPSDFIAKHRGAPKDDVGRTKSD